MSNEPTDNKLTPTKVEAEQDWESRPPDQRQAIEDYAKRFTESHPDLFAPKKADDK